MDGGRKLRTARGQDLSLSSVSAVPAPSTGGRRKKRSQDPDPGPHMQDQHTREEVARICHSAPWAEEVEEPGLRNEMDRSRSQSSHTREEVARPYGSNHSWLSNRKFLITIQVENSVFSRRILDTSLSFLYVTSLLPIHSAHEEILYELLPTARTASNCQCIYELTGQKLN